MPTTASAVPYDALLAAMAETPLGQDAFVARVSNWAKQLGTELFRTGTKPRQKGEHINNIDDPMVGFLEKKGLVLDYGRNGEVYVPCPWKHEHTSDSGPSESAWFPAGTNGYERGNYRCLHAHCDGRGASEFELAVGYIEEDFPDLTAGDESQQRRRRFEAVPFGEFINGPQPEWLVKGLVPKAGLGMVYGASGAGKSFFVLDLACSIARGIQWRDRKVKRGNVLYVCAEGAGGFRSRGKAYVLHNQVDLSASLFMIPAAPNFLSATDPNEVIDEARRIDASLVVVDTLAQVTPGGDENSAAEMGKALEQCRRIYETTGATVLLVHHAGKDASRGARGWSGIRAAADFEIEVTAAAGGAEKIARVTKMKDGRDGDAFGFCLAPVLIEFDADGDEVMSCVVEPTDLPKAGKTPPRGQKGLVWKAYHELAELGADKVDMAALVARAVESFPMPQIGERDRRKDGARRALTKMVEEALFVSDGEKVWTKPSDWQTGH